jgi:hypothetical protein
MGKLYGASILYGWCTFVAIAPIDFGDFRGRILNGRRVYSVIMEALGMASSM